MSAEHQTADAYAGSASADEAARAGVDSATAILAETFRDFPDSATVWDNEQTANSGTPSNPAVVPGTYNEGTTVYLRAVPSASSPTSAVPLPHTTLTNNGAAYPSNDPAGNDPGNPACQAFVLPLVSGVLNGQAQLPAYKSNMFPAAMNLGESDPTKQNWVDLNVRRFGKTSTYPNGDLQGAIGSPSTWNGVGPKPARAYWVNLTGNNGLITGRYAFWMEDESFRANNSLLNAAQAPYDNLAAGGSTRPLDSSNGKPRLEAPTDLMLYGPLAAAAVTDPSGTSTNIVNVRQQGYPGNFFPDRVAFSHALDGTTQQGSQAIDELRYLTTNQSSALNLTRHGSQRLNLNTAITTTTSSTAIQTQVDELVQTLAFHLPYLGERFYRTSTSVGGLNDATQVPGSTNAGGYSPPTSGSNAQIYYYKVAANLRDYVDTDSQPTVIQSGGTVMTGAPTADLGEFSPPGPQANPIWAQGKECTPYIQEVAVRYRPTASYTAGAQTGRFSINVDYYVELWNMSNRDVSASQMGTPSIWVRDQQTWDASYKGDVLTGDPATPLVNNYIPASMDLQIDLTGVVFHAGAVTVITTDPDYRSYIYTERTASGGRSGKKNNPSGALNLANVILCPIASGSRLYTGAIAPQDPTHSTPHSVGIQLGMPFEGSSSIPASTNYPSTGTEVSLVNSQGYFDVVRGAITKTGACGYHIYTVATDNDTTQGGYNDYSYGSSMMGNVQDTGGGPVAGSEVPTVSQLGDPRTTNEQLKVNVLATTGADGTRFMASSRTLGTLNYIVPTSGSSYPGLQPDTTTTDPTTGRPFGWPDYYKFPTGTARPSPDATTAPAIIAGSSTADGLITSIGQLGDVFDPARVPGSDINYSHGGGRTFKIGQHDDLYSDDPQSNAYPAGFSSTNTTDNVPLSSGWASWRLTDIFDVADPIQLPGRININGITRDNGAALLSALQGFTFHPTTASGTSDPIIHGDALAGLAGASLDTTGTSSGFSQMLAEMKLRLDAVALASSNGRVKPFFERGELSELKDSSGNPLFGTTTTGSNKTLVSTVDMNKTSDHSREELFRRLAEMICTRGNTFTVYAMGQSILQTTAGGALKITGTKRMRVTFRLAPKVFSAVKNAYVDFHPAYVVDPTTGLVTQNTFTSTSPTAQPTDPTQAGSIGVIPRFAKPDRYDVQILEVASY